MAVRIRMKKMGRKHRPFFRICAMDQRTARGGKVLEELGTYDPMVPDTDARAILKGERVNHWLSVGAQPSDKVRVLIRKYGPEGTHLEQQKAALDKLAQPRQVPPPGPVASKPKSAEEASAAPPPQVPLEEQRAAAQEVEQPAAAAVGEEATSE